MGRKIQRFAKWVMIIGISVCLLIAFFVMIRCYDRNGGFYHLRYATVNGGAPANGLPSFSEWEAKGNDILNSIVISAGFLFASVGILFTFLPVYWLGCLYSNVELLQKKLDAIEESVERSTLHGQ